jgi:tetratricopeptide (TPR) repeat protein/transcriptional regulator with XRE-family HTH domain
VSAPVFAEMLVRARAQAGLTQERLAERAGLSVRTVRNLEGGGQPRPVSAELLADALGLPAEHRETFLDAARAQPGQRQRLPGHASASRTPGALADPDAGPASPRFQLPVGTRAFTGRARELGQLIALAHGDPAGAVAIAAIDGMAGVGKTALAVHAAHRLREQFPDGQLFIDLHGYSSGSGPLSAGEALDWLLRCLGVPPELIPGDLDERAAFYRDRLDGSRTLIILDNAASTAQVRPLLPGGFGCMVLVTSRRRLSGLDDTYSVALDVLPEHDAMTLLHNVTAPGLVIWSQPAARELIALCGSVPLAIRIAAARMRHRRTLTIERLVEQLRDDHARLDHLQDEDRGMAAVFDLSYAALSLAEQYMFRCLGLILGPDFDVYAAANLTGTGLRSAERILESLVDHNLLIERAPGRYHFHDLLRVYAHTLVQDDPAQDRAASIARLLDFYQQTAQAADRHLARHSHPGQQPAAVSVVMPPLSGWRDALARAGAERDNLLAVIRAPVTQPARVIVLTAAIAAFLQHEGSWQQAAALHQAAVAAAHGLGDRRGEAGACQDLGRVHYLTGDFQSAADLHERALAIYRDLGDLHGEANAICDLALVRHATGDYAAVADLHEWALATYRDLARPQDEAGALRSMGALRQLTGDYVAAADLLQQSLVMARDLGDHPGEYNALLNLGRVSHATGDYVGAADLLQQSLVMARDLGDPLSEGNALYNLGRVRDSSGDYQAAVALYDKALTIASDLGCRLGEAATLWALGRTRQAIGDYLAALDLLDRSLAIYRSIGHRLGEACALHELGRVRLATCDYLAAADLLERALPVFTEHGPRRDEADVLHDLGRVRHAIGDHPTAAGLLTRAQAIFQDLGDRRSQAAVRRTMNLLTVG